MKNKLIALIVCVFAWIPSQSYSLEKSNYSEELSGMLCVDNQFECLSFLESLDIKDIYFSTIHENDFQKNFNDFYVHNRALKLYYIKIIPTSDDASTSKNNNDVENLNYFFNQLKIMTDTTDHLRAVFLEKPRYESSSFIESFNDQLIPVNLNKNYFPLNVNDVLGFGIRLRL